MFRKILIFSFILSFHLVVAQDRNCKKCEQMFTPKMRGSQRSKPFIGATYVSLGVQHFFALQDKKAYDHRYGNLFALNFGVTHQIKKRFAVDYLFSTSVSNMADTDERFASGFRGSLTYFFRESHQGLGIGSSINLYQTLITLPSLNLHYAFRNRSIINDYHLGVMYAKNRWNFTLGVKTGVQVWK